MKKLDWHKVLFTYVVMCMLGTVCWGFVTWSLERWWVGALIGAAMHTMLLLSVFGVPWFKALKKPRMYTLSIVEAYAYAMFFGIIGHAAHLHSLNGPLYIGGLLSCAVLTAMLIISWVVSVIQLNRK